MTVENMVLLDAYLNHYAQGKSFREIARDLKVQPSTVLRRARRCDEKTDHPEWEYLVQKLADHRTAHGDPGARVNPQEVLAALNLSDEETRAQIRLISEVCSSTNSYIVVGDMPKAIARTGDESTQARLDREVVCYLYAMGFIEPQRGKPIDGRVRVFEPVCDLKQSVAQGTPIKALGSPTETQTGTESKKFKPNPEHPLELLHRRDRELYNRDVVNTGLSFHEMYITRDTVSGRSEYEAVKAKMPIRTFTFLEMICGQRLGLAVCEKELAMPARSAKAVLLHALDLFTMVLADLRGQEERLAG